MSYDALSEREPNYFTAPTIEPRPPPPPSPQFSREDPIPQYVEHEGDCVQSVDIEDDVLFDALLAENERQGQHSTPQRLMKGVHSFLEYLVPPGGLTASIFELLSATLGAGSMALPFCYKESGLFLATALVFVGAISAFYSIHLLAVVSEITGRRSYEELVNHVFGKQVEIVLDLAIIIFTYGSTVAYIIVIGDTLPPLAALVGLDPDALYTQRWFLMLLATVFLVFPLSLLKKISSLRFTAILGFGATLYLIGAMFYRVTEKYAVAGGIDTDRITLARFDATSFFVAAPIVFYAFSSHVNIFSIAKELKDPTPQRVDTVIVGNVVLATLVYGIIGLCGYLTFLEHTADNVISNYDTYDIPIQLGSFLLTVAVILNIPLNTHPLRITLDWMLFGPQSPIPENLRYYGELVFMVFTALVIAIFVPSITVVFGLLGATATSFCCYIMPGLLYIKVAPFPWYHYKSWLSIALVVTGTLSGVTSTVIIIKDLVKDL